MNQYICHKEVHAKPMMRGEYNNYRGWEIPEDENPNDVGYLVVYNKGNDDQHESWSPKHVFDDSYSVINDKPSETAIMKYFTYKYLPKYLQDVSSPVCQLAYRMDSLHPNAEKSAGLRKLLEAKDCFVRSII